MATTVKEGNISVPSVGFNAKYSVIDRSIRTLKEKLCDNTFLTNLSALFTNYADYINGIKWYPFLGSQKFYTLNYSSDRLRLGNFTINDTDLYARQIVDIKKTTLIGTFNITRRYNNFLDFEPYTKIELYVPYFSFITLPVNEVMGKEVSVYLSVDFDTGMGTVYIQVNGTVIMTSSTKLGIDIPIGSSNLNQIFKDNIANVTKIVGGVATAVAGGGIAKLGGLAMAGSGALNMITNSTIRYLRGSLTGGTDMLASPTKMYLYIIRPNPVPVTTDYNHIKGVPLGETRALSLLNGYTVINDIHLEGFDEALDEEIKDIESQMKAGIYL